MINYNFIQKLLHDIYLKNKFIKKSLYEIEKIVFLDSEVKNLENANHVFITGLPRSGTTILLNFIHSSGSFASLTYENAPFIMATNLASKIFYKNKIEKKERFHQDGIFYDLSSPESFDEVFFNTFSDKEIEEELNNFISLILKNKNKKRYLSKNNLHFKRINFLRKKYVKSLFLIPFRDPLQQSYSLLNQHKIFTNLHSKNDFLRRYMNYFGHNEFGANHKSWNVINKYRDFSNINYWLEQWLLFYKNIFSELKHEYNCSFICYENLDQRKYIEEISIKAKISYEKSFYFNCKKRSPVKDYDEELYDESFKLYEKMKLSV